MAIANRDCSAAIEDEDRLLREARPGGIVKTSEEVVRLSQCLGKRVLLLRPGQVVAETGCVEAVNAARTWAYLSSSAPCDGAQGWFPVASTMVIEVLGAASESFYVQLRRGGGLV